VRNTCSPVVVVLPALVILLFAAISIAAEPPETVNEADSVESARPNNGLGPNGEPPTLVKEPPAEDPKGLSPWQTAVVQAASGCTSATALGLCGIAASAALPPLGAPCFVGSFIACPILVGSMETVVGDSLGDSRGAFLPSIAAATLAATLSPFVAWVTVALGMLATLAIKQGGTIEQDQATQTIVATAICLPFFAPFMLTWLPMGLANVVQGQPAFDRTTQNLVDVLGPSIAVATAVSISMIGVSPAIVSLLISKKKKPEDTDVRLPDPLWPSYPEEEEEIGVSEPQAPNPIQSLLQRGTPARPRGGTSDVAMLF